VVDDRWATLLPARPWRGWISLRPGWQLCLAAEILASNGAHQPRGWSPLNKRSVLYPAQIGAFILLMSEASWERQGPLRVDGGLSCIVQKLAAVGGEGSFDRAVDPPQRPPLALGSLATPAFTGKSVASGPP
jgi:hypothetical protein